MAFLNDNKKRFELGAKVFAIVVWAFCLIVSVAGILNGNEGFRVVCSLIVAGINVYMIVRCVKSLRDNYKSMY